MLVSRLPWLCESILYIGLDLAWPWLLLLDPRVAVAMALHSVATILFVSFWVVRVFLLLLLLPQVQ